jgi:hypothetical protein
MSAQGHERRFVQATLTSALPSIPDVFFRHRSERSKRAISGTDAVRQTTYSITSSARAAPKADRHVEAEQDRAHVAVG